MYLFWFLTVSTVLVWCSALFKARIYFLLEFYFFLAGKTLELFLVPLESLFISSHWMMNLSSFQIFLSVFSNKPNLSLLLMVLFQWFLMQLSVLPGRNFAMMAHLFPKELWANKSVLSSSSVHFFLLIFGLRWLCHLSLHYFPILFLKFEDIWDQFFGPFFFTRCIKRASSVEVQLPFCLVERRDLGLPIFFLRFYSF